MEPGDLAFMFASLNENTAGLCVVISAQCYTYCSIVAFTIIVTFDHLERILIVHNLFYPASHNFFHIREIRILQICRRFNSHPAIH